jgi:hypothetical protein
MTFDSPATCISHSLHQRLASTAALRGSVAVNSVPDYVLCFSFSSISLGLCRSLSPRSAVVVSGLSPNWHESQETISVDAASTLSQLPSRVHSLDMHMQKHCLVYRYDGSCVFPPPAR